MPSLHCTIHCTTTVPGLWAVHLSPGQARVGLCVEGLSLTLPRPLASPPVRCSNSIPTPGASQVLCGPWTGPGRRVGDSTIGCVNKGTKPKAAVGCGPPRWLSPRQYRRPAGGGSWLACRPGVLSFRPRACLRRHCQRGGPSRIDASHAPLPWQLGRRDRPRHDRRR